jgi:pimeloyl-ACP methyl ester carboxylesterase
MPTRSRRRLLIGLTLLLALAALAAALHHPDQPPATVEARWADAGSRFTDVQGLRVHWRDEGPRDDPEPIVLLHATASSLRSWDAWAAELSKTRRVLRLDLPGAGLTGPFRGAWSADDYRGDTYARLVRGWMDAVGLPRAALVGSSLGGEVAWRVAVQAPARVARLVLMAATGPAYRPLQEPLAFRLSPWPGLNRLSEWTLPEALVRRSLQAVFADPARVDAALVAQTRALALREGNRAALRHRLAQRRRDTADVERLRGLPTPVLLLWGREDRLVPPAVAEAFQALLPQARSVLLDGVGHLPHLEQPQRALEAVRPFLQGDVS